MSSDFTSHAMIAKVQGLFARRLNDRNYKELINKHSIAEIASYLKKETYFFDVLEGINEQAIHRGQLEFLVRQNTYDKMKKLLRYVDSDKHEYYQLIVYYYEISLISFKVRTLGRENTVNIEFNYMHIDDKHASFNYGELYAIKTYEGLAALLKNTRYSSILDILNGETDGEVNYTEIEQQLSQLIFNQLIEEIIKDYAGKTRETIQLMLEMRMELVNLSRLYRLKKYFQPTIEEIRKLVVVQPVLISESIWEKWITESEADDIYEMLKETKYHKYMKEETFSFIEYHIQSILYQIAQNEIRTSRISEVVYYQFMNFLNIEVENIICVIEGVRYNHEPSRIEARIVQ